MNAREEAVSAELAALRDPPVPAEVSARWAAALAAESRRGAVRPRRLRPVPVLLAAAALLMLVLALWPRPPQAARIGLAADGLAAVGSTDAGALADPARRAGCLRAVGVAGIDPAAALLGGRQVVVDGRRGVLLVLPSGARGVFQVVVVDPDCGPAGGILLATTTVGGP